MWAASFLTPCLLPAPTTVQADRERTTRRSISRAEHVLTAGEKTFAETAIGEVEVRVSVVIVGVLAIRAPRASLHV